jgi:glutaredoxin 3
MIFGSSSVALTAALPFFFLSGSTDAFVPRSLSQTASGTLPTPFLTMGAKRKLVKSVNSFDSEVGKQLAEGEKQLALSRKALVECVVNLAGKYDKAAVQERLKYLIRDNPVLMLSFTTCPNCVKAKELLDSTSITYTIVELDSNPYERALWAKMGLLLGDILIPGVWIGGTFVGGCDIEFGTGALTKLSKSGEFTGLMQSATHAFLP